MRFVKCFIFLMLMLSGSFVFAGTAQITEVMYDVSGSDNGREWIEIKNVGTTTLNLSKWKFFEGNTNHSLMLKQGSSTVPALSFALIVSDYVKFITDHPNFSGTIFDSSFSLSNSGEILKIKDGSLNTVDTFLYNSSMGGSGDGRSLQKNNDGVWVTGEASPGQENIFKEKEVRKVTKISAVEDLPKKYTDSVLGENKKADPVYEDVSTTTSLVSKRIVIDTERTGETPILKWIFGLAGLILISIFTYFAFVPTKRNQFDFEHGDELKAEDFNIIVDQDDLSENKD